METTLQTSGVREAYLETLGVATRVSMVERSSLPLCNVMGPGRVVMFTDELLWSICPGRSCYWSRLWQKIDLGTTIVRIAKQSQHQEMRRTGHKLPKSHMHDICVNQSDSQSMRIVNSVNSIIGSGQRQWSAT